MNLSKKQDVLTLKLQILQYSDAYYQLYHLFSKKISDKKTAKISGLFTSSLYLLKNLLKQDNNTLLKRKEVVFSIKRLKNELALLQYQVDFTANDTRVFTAKADALIELLM